MKKLGLMAATFVIGLTVGIPGSADAQQLRFMTGPQGGAWYPLGGAIQNMAAETMGANIIVMPGGGIANIQGVQNGDADLAFGNSISTVDAVHGREPFDGEPFIRNTFRWSGPLAAASGRWRISKVAAW